VQHEPSTEIIGLERSDDVVWSIGRYQAAGRPTSPAGAMLARRDNVASQVFRTMWTRSVVPFARKYSLGLSSKYERGHAEDMVPCKEFFGAAMVSFSAR
jgi:hypothetical protein